MVNARQHGILRHLRSLRDAHALAEVSDAQLLEQFARAHEEAPFVALVRRHGPMVWGVSRRLLPHVQDAEDVFQATFLLLARKADSIRKAESVGSWLHGVAHRLALKVREQQARRQSREKRAADMRQTRPSSETSLSEVRAALDAALGELPEKYRAALVACYLEGQTQAEAAGRLGCPLATVRSRVVRGRNLLRERLAKRGLTLSTAGLAALLIASAAPAAAPAALVEAAVQAALPFAAGQSAADLCSQQVAGLVAGGLRAMFLTKVKSATALLLAAGLLAGAAALMQRVTAADEAAKLPTAKAKPPAADDVDSATFSGRVLDPAGKPFAGAKLHLIAHRMAKPQPVHVQTTSTAGGAFRLAVAPPEARRLADDSSWSTTAVVATAEGYGPAVGVCGAFAATADLTLRLAKDDVPIRGRILDLQGKPIAGVTVRVEGLSVPVAGDLTPWLQALETNQKDGYPVESRYLQGFSLSAGPWLFPPAVTDATGRFQIKGVGRERVVPLVLEGPTIARDRVSVYTRPGKSIRASMFARNPQGGQLQYHGASFDHLAVPTRPIVGVVRDKDTGKPLAGVTIQSDKFAGNNTHGDSSVRTVTDVDGRYRLVGMPKGLGNVIKAVPGPQQPYFQSEQEVENQPGLEPITVDFKLKRGVRVKGRVLDKATGRPVFANVSYVVFRDNPRHGEVSGFTTEDYLQTSDDGSFQLVAFPGRGLLTARGWSDHYRIGVGADRIAGKDEGGFFQTAPHLCGSDTYHAYVELRPADNAESVTRDVLLDPGTMPRGTVVGPDSKPLAGAQALGLTAYGRSRNWTRAPLKRAEFTVYGLTPADEREVVFVHPSKRLTGVLRVRGNAKEPLTVKLEPWGTVTGRLVGPDGSPRSGQLLQVRDWLLPDTSFQTDGEGRFRIEGLAPGVKYTMDVIRNGNPTAAVFAGLTLKAGETRDLGTIVVQSKK